MSDTATLSPVFKDGIGDEWDLTLNVGLIEDIKEKTTVDFHILLEKPAELATLLIKHPQKLAELLWVICEEQATKRSLEPRAFGRRLTRETIDESVNSLIAAIILFYPRGSAGRALAEKLPELIRQMDEEIYKRANKRATEILSNIATDLRVSSEGSTPDHTVADG